MGKAATQFMDTSAKSAGVAGELTARKGFGCTRMPGGSVTGDDAFVVPNVADSDGKADAARMAALMLIPQTQAAFGVKTDSIPARPDIDVPVMDADSQTGMMTPQDRAGQVPSIGDLATRDLVGATRDGIAPVPAPAGMPTDDFIAQFVAAMEPTG